MKPTKEYTLRDIQSKINQNRCTHKDPNTCPHYMELFDICTKPSVKCSYRKNLSKKLNTHKENQTP